MGPTAVVTAADAGEEAMVADAADAADAAGDAAEVGDAAEGPDPAGRRVGLAVPVDLAAVRARLAAGQSALLAALVAGGGDPEGFDQEALAATRHALLDKRRARVAHRWPTLAAEPEFNARFLSWAAGRPPAGAHADGLGFGDAYRDELSEDARVELLRARCARRRLAVLADRTANGTLLALRTPGLGTVILRTPR
ncbi:hypothetical protein [Candidatus Frankia nodulisporulans]|uniref:hypothetical protein n=1 Tax=Candidatus Frankia nodulisporulans TaxID=2060052 RepID=UPI001CDC0A74|nr:hypothetical protein [Candidatus Frankia nodulisporulans]